MVSSEGLELKLQLYALDTAFAGGVNVGVRFAVEKLKANCLGIHSAPVCTKDHAEDDRCLCFLCVADQFAAKVEEEGIDDETTCSPRQQGNP